MSAQPFSVSRRRACPTGFPPLAFGEQRAPEYLDRHPFGRIPAVQHGDFRLYETQAILRYIDRLFPTPAFVPADPRREARMNQIMGITDWYVMPDVSAGICFNRLIAPKLGRPVDEARIAASVPRAAVCIDEIARLLGGQAYMAGDALSIADLMLIPHLALFGGDAGRPADVRASSQPCGLGAAHDRAAKPGQHDLGASGEFAARGLRSGISNDPWRCTSLFKVNHLASLPHHMRLRVMRGDIYAPARRYSARDDLTRSF